MTNMNTEKAAKNVSQKLMFRNGYLQKIMKANMIMKESTISALNVLKNLLMFLDGLQIVFIALKNNNL